MTPVVSATTQEQAPALLNSQNNSPLATLPKDVFWKILLLMRLDDISAVSLTCKHLNAVSQDNHLWRSLFNRRFPTPLPNGTCLEPGACLKAFRHQYFLTHGMYATRLLSGHTDSVNAFLWVDGNLISGSSDKTIKVWDLKSGTCIRTLEGHTASVNSFVWADGNLISGSSDKTIKVWDLKSGTCIRTLEGHEDGVRSLLWVDGMLISGSRDKTIKVWDLKSCTFIRTLEGHSRSIQSLVCVNGNLISASVDGIKIWDIKSGTCTRTLPVEGHGYVPLVSADGNLISGSGYFNSLIKIWDLNSGTCTRTLKVDKSHVRSLLWANGNLISAFDDGSIKIWDLKNGRCATTLKRDDPNFDIVPLFFWADGNLIMGIAHQIAIRDFSAPTDLIFAEIASIFPFLKGRSPSGNFVKGAMERFSRMPKKAKDEIYVEFCQILQLPACDLEIAKNTFHDLSRDYHEQRAQAIENYLNSKGKEVKL